MTAIRSSGLVIVLAAFWVALWGRLSPATALSGLLLGLVLVRVRPATGRWSITPKAVPRLLAVLLADLATTNIAMARAALSRDRNIPEHIVEVPLRRAGAPLDGLIDLLVTLTPGSIAIGFTRREDGPSVLSVHALGFTPDEVTESVHRLEQALCEAVSATPIPRSPEVPA